MAKKLKFIILASIVALFVRQFSFGSTNESTTTEKKKEAPNESEFGCDLNFGRMPKKLAFRRGKYRNSHRMHLRVPQRVKSDFELRLHGAPLLFCDRCAAGHHDNDRSAACHTAGRQRATRLFAGSRPAPLF